MSLSYIILHILYIDFPNNTGTNLANICLLDKAAYCSESFWFVYCAM